MEPVSVISYISDAWLLFYAARQACFIDVVQMGSNGWPAIPYNWKYMYKVALN